MNDEKKADFDTDPKILAPSYNRDHVYFIAAIIRILLALVFIDRRDGPVFFAVGRDILVDHHTIYFENSTQVRFNYFPFAYLAILPGQLLYYLMPFENLYLQRLFLKLPLIISDLLAARLGNKISTDIISTNIRNRVDTKKIVSQFEVFILFNPFIIYASSVKGQFDVIPAMFALLAWKLYKSNKYVRSGVFTSSAILFKQYVIIISFFIWIKLMKSNKKAGIMYLIGHIILVVPVFIVTYFLNFEGMIQHAILFHIDRLPNGFSLTSIIYYLIYFGGRVFFSNSLAGYFADIFLLTSTVMLILLLIYLGYHLWLSAATDEELLYHILYGLLIFFLLNKVFLFHYLPILFVFWVEYKKEIAQDIEMRLILWNILLIPIIINFRVAHMTPIDVQELLGNYWVVILWIIFQFIHFTLLKLALRENNDLFPTKKVKWIYIIFQLALFINLGIQFYLASLEFGKPLSDFYK